MQNPKYPHSNSDQKEPPFTVYNYTIVVYLLIIAISSMFFALTMAYAYTRITTGVPIIQVPSIFIISTLLLISSSLTINIAKKQYLLDNTKGYFNALIYTIILSLSFLYFQNMGWQALLAKNLFLTQSTTISYVYLLSGLHFLHVVIGLPFLVNFAWTSYTKMQEPVSVLIYFSDPDKKEKLRLLGVYWHYLDGLWIYLILFFFISSLF